MVTYMPPTPATYAGLAGSSTPPGFQAPRKPDTLDKTVTFLKKRDGIDKVGHGTCSVGRPFTWFVVVGVVGSRSSDASICLGVHSCHPIVFEVRGENGIV
jgi:hypothetical protein